MYPTLSHLSTRTQAEKVGLTPNFTGLVYKLAGSRPTPYRAEFRPYDTQALYLLAAAKAALTDSLSTVQVYVRGAKVAELRGLA